MINALKDEVGKNLETIFQQRGNLKRYKPNQMIFMEDDREECLYYISTGLVKLSIVSNQGKEKTLFILSQGQFFGEVSLIDGLEYSVNAETLVNTDIYTMNSKDINEVLAEEPGVALDLLKIMAQKMRIITQQVRDMVFYDITGRLANQIYIFSQQFGFKTEEGIVLDIILTHQELANLLGASRVTITKTLNQLQDNGIIKIVNRRILIPDIVKLKKYIGRD